MGTRSVIGIKHKGDTSLLYSQYDGYPSGVGLDVVKFIREMQDHVVKHQLETAVRVDITATVPPALYAYCESQGYADPGVSTGVDWYSALRELQGDVKKILESGFFPEYRGGNNEDYGYIIDLDEENFEVYEWGTLVGTFPFSDFTNKTDDELYAWAEKMDEG